MIRFSGSLLLLQLRLVLFFLLVATGSVLRVQATSDADADADASNAVVTDTLTLSSSSSSSNPPTKPRTHSQQRPTIYTYFERIDVSNRTTGMTDDEDFDLLGFWKERWDEAGYTPVVLTAETVAASFPPPTPTPLQFPNNNQSHHFTNLDRYESIRSKLETLPLDDFGKILFRRWMAMAAVGGGWFSDYDNFPLWDLSHTTTDDGPGQAPTPKLEMAWRQLPNGAKLTLHDILSPTLASGSGNEWLDTLEALLDETNRHCLVPPRRNSNFDDFDCFYTDSLGIHSLIADHHPLAPKTTRRVAVPFDKNDPVSSNDPSLCTSRDFRTKLTVHFGPGALQKGRHVPPNDRLPGRRSRLARDWLDRWKQLCHPPQE